MAESFSFSKLDAYKGCPFKYKLQYVDGNFVFVGSIATEFGSAIHATEEAIAKSIIAGEQINYITLKNNLILKFAEIEKKYSKDYLVDDGKSDRNYRDKAFEYLDEGIYRLEKFMEDHPTYEIVGVERKFKFEYNENFGFNGAIDRIFHDTLTDKYIIQDIKSYAVPVEEDNLTTPLQFVVYNLAVQKIFGCTDEQIECEYYLPLVNGGLTQKAGTKGYMNRGVKKILDLYENICNKEYKPKQSALCHWCNFCATNENAPEKTKYLCPYFCQWTRENKTFTQENKWTNIDDYPVILEAYHKKYNIR